MTKSHIEQASLGRCERLEDQWTCKIPQSIEEAKELIEVGFEYVVRYMENQCSGSAGEKFEKNVQKVEY